MTSTQRAVRKASAAYRRYSVARGDYGFCRSSAEFETALRAECERAVTAEDRWHAREQIAYALACRTIKHSAWMDAFIGGRV